MAGQDEQERHNRWKALGIRTDIPHPARVYEGYAKLSLKK